MPNSDPTPALNMDNALNLLTEVQGIVARLNGEPAINAEADNNKARMRASAQRSRDLLYAAHLADLCRAEILNEYHRFKGMNPPTVEV